MNKEQWFGFDGRGNPIMPLSRRKSVPIKYSKFKETKIGAFLDITPP